MLQPQLLYFLFMQSCLIKENNMKATGIVRRMDDLGRIHIPKELRKQVFGLEGWDSCTDVPLEFFIDGDSIVIKRYKENENE